MATPNDRRILFSSQVISEESFSTTNLQETTEEGYPVGRPSYTKYKIDTNVNKKLGGKGTATIKPAQWGDGWSSMFHENVHWEDLSDDTDISGNRWEDENTCWDGTLYISGSGRLLTPDLADPNKLGFLYIKNVGNNRASVWLNDNSRDTSRTFGGREDLDFDEDGLVFQEDYRIKISPGASLCLRGNGAVQDCDDVQVAGMGTYIEYLVALEAT